VQVPETFEPTSDGDWAESTQGCAGPEAAEFRRTRTEEIAGDADTHTSHSL
jgi:hypothetical protein